jgi:Tfp pilus assembly protein PilF
VLLFHVCALLSKPMAVSLPVVLLLLDMWPLRRFAGFASARWSIAAALLREKAALVAASLAMCIVTIAAQQQSGAVASIESFSPAQMLFNVVVSYALYLRDFLLPLRLAIFYPFTPIDALTEFLPAIGLLVLVVAACAAGGRERRYALVALGWFVVTLLPVIGVIQVGSQARADRYMYIPSMGLLLGLAALMASATARARLRTIAALAIVGTFWTFLCFLQVGYWESPAVLYKHAADVTRDNVFAETRLIDLLIAQRELDEAYRRASELATRHPERYEGFMSLGDLALAAGDAAAAERWLRLALDRAPAHWHIRNDLGIAILRQGRRDEGCAMLASAIARGGDSLLLRGNLAAGGCDGETRAEPSTPRG